MMGEVRGAALPGSRANPTPTAEAPMFANDVRLLGVAIARRRHRNGSRPPTMQRDYGSAARSNRSSWYRAPSSSASRSGDRLQRVPEVADDDDGVPPAWINGGDGRGADDDVDVVEGDDAEGSVYRRAVRLYAFVPLGSLIFLLIFAFLPALIQSMSLPHAPSTGRLTLAVLLSAAFWCLAHALRVPLYDEYIKLVPAVTGFAHVILLAAIQESLRLASFAIFTLGWPQVGDNSGGPYPHGATRAAYTVFREVWALALGWALAEVCAGVLQGYEQLSLYEDADEYSLPLYMGSDVVEATQEPRESFDEEGEESTESDALGLIRQSMWLSDADNVKVASPQDSDVDAALSRLTNVRAREELEELYGEPYIDIPVFVPLLQRLDSLLLSLGITLLLAAAYLPLPPFPPASLSQHHPSPSSSLQPLHPHALALVPMFILLTLTHAALGALHAPPALARVGLPAAAYASCIVGLALAFGGVGVWNGVW
ncbi:hypothetical protein M0805_007268 [Coniferiporia weirii]|nr:hypothetical protein M0805_007268 [Coniferiporia weirii]